MSSLQYGPSGLIRVKWWNFLWDSWLSPLSLSSSAPWKHNRLNKRPDLSVLQCKIMGLLTFVTVNTYLQNYSLPRCTGENEKVYPFFSQGEKRNCHCFFLSLHCVNLCEIVSTLYSHCCPILHVCKSDNAYFLMTNSAYSVLYWYGWVFCWKDCFASPKAYGSFLSKAVLVGFWVLL